MHNMATMTAALAAIRGLYVSINEIEVQRSQKAATRNRTRLKVTTCLYLSFNIRARSLSTLIAVSVSKETPQKIAPIVTVRAIA